MLPDQPTMIILNPQAFAVSALANSESLTVAHRMVESYLARPDIPLGVIMQDLCSVPYLFEFVVSSLPNSKELVDRILDTFPTDPTVLDVSFPSILIRRLSSILFSLPPQLFPVDTLRRIGRYKKYVEDALPTPASSSEDPECDRQKKSRPKAKKKVPSFDVTLFRRLGNNVPLSDTEATRMAHEITNELKMILKFNLDLLLQPFLAQQLKDAYVSTPSDITTTPSVLEEVADTVAVEPRPSAFPKVQPVKAALYFENADGFGEWRIVIGTDATKTLRQLATEDKKKCAIVLKKIKQLSNGHFSGENQKRLNGPSEVPIFEAKMQRDLRLVYQVDVMLHRDGEIERQVIKIYGIYTHTQLNRIWDAIGRHLSGRGKEYRRRCIFRNRPVDPGSDVYLPASFPPEDPRDDVKPTPLILSDEEKGELHSLLVLGKYVTFSQAFLRGLVLDRDVHHAFELSPHERKIVDCMTSCFVLGRSGTGKTTSMLFKMLGIQHAWELQESETPKPRQVFVTKSHILAINVERYFTELLESLALAGYSCDELKKMQARRAESWVVYDDDEEQARNIPQRYSALEERHFPLFVSFDKLVKMIAVDILSGDDPEVQRVAKFLIDTDGISVQDSFVGYEVFAGGYWPHLPQSLTKGLDSWPVFSELIGVIKGSESSLSTPDGFLGEEAYCNLSARCNPAFANQRQTLYAIFEAYCKLKKERYHHDAADRTHAVLRVLLAGMPLGGQQIDYLYVDEAQDNLLIDALLLRLICQNPEGLFWAGDTAQTISAGSSFRFDDLKAFLYRIEQNRSLYLIQDRPVYDPTTFQLAVNFRSHGGIVNCAHSVVERIARFWPHTIDILQPERGIVEGPKPMFFCSWEQDAVRYEQFLFGKSRVHIDLGARQCILVRDDKARLKLMEDLPECPFGTVWTLYESKGHEFDDVLLYNFFEDSVVDVSRWRVLLNYANGEVDGHDLAKVSAPSFEREEGRFAGVCSELKALYVGITRARRNLWIYDKSEKGEPMRMIWTSRNQIQNFTPGMDVPHLAVASSPAEWELSGRYLFNHERFPQAKHCFERALKPRMAEVCEAFHLRKVARAKGGVGSSKDAFFTAADAFTRSAEDAPPGKDKLKYYHYAADCYVQAGEYQKAAIGYLSTQEYELAARCYRRAELFDEALGVLHGHSEYISLNYQRELLTACRLFYCRQPDGGQPRFPLFKDLEEKLEFLENYDLDLARISLLVSLGRYIEAANVHLEEDRPLDAIRVLLKDDGSRDAIQHATKILLDNLWHRCSFAVPLREVATNQVVSELLGLADLLTLDYLDPLDRGEISMFVAIARGDIASLGKLADVFIKEKREMAALLAFEHFFHDLPVLKSYSLLEMSRFLDRFREYVSLLLYVITHENPLGNSIIKRLFCIARKSDTDYSMEPGSFLYRLATAGGHRPLPYQSSMVTASKKEIVSELRKHLRDHLRRRVSEENDLCCGASVFSQCLIFIVTGQCNQVDCPQEHVKPVYLNLARYNARIGIHLQQIHILYLVGSANPSFRKSSCILDWLVRIYDALNPQFDAQGSIADLNLYRIFGASRYMGAMKCCLRDAVLALRSDRDRPGFLTIVLKLTRLLFTFDEPKARECIQQARFHELEGNSQEFLNADGRNIFEDIIDLFDGSKKTCITGGLSLLSHVVKSSLPVDLSVLCDLLEEIVGKICVSWHLSYDPPLDGLTLPRSWLSSHKDFFAEKVDIKLILSTLDSVKELLIRLQSEPASGLYTLSHAKLSSVLCDVFSSRICRALCFLADGVLNCKVRDRVKDIFDVLRQTEYLKRAHPLYQIYVQSRDGGYLKAVYYEADKSASMNLVQLLYKGRNPSLVLPLRLCRIRHIWFMDPSEILSQLVPRCMIALQKPRGRAPAVVPQGGRVPDVESREEDGQKQQEKVEIGPEVEVREEAIPVSDNAQLPIHERDPTEAEISAARTIQAAYRTYCKRYKTSVLALGKGMNGRQKDVFMTCLKNARAFGWSETPYRALYLSALPRLVVCLDEALNIVRKYKARTKRLLLKESNERLEELGQQMDRITPLFKEGVNLSKMIEPNADMHQSKDRAEMKKVVLRIKDFIDKLPIPAPNIQEDFDAVYQLVVVENRPTIKPVKPTLNIEDLLE